MMTILEIAQKVFYFLDKITKENDPKVPFWFHFGVYYSYLDLKLLTNSIPIEFREFFIKHEIEFSLDLDAVSLSSNFLFPSLYPSGVDRNFLADASEKDLGLITSSLLNIAKELSRLMTKDEDFEFFISAYLIWKSQAQAKRDARLIKQSENTYSST